jgi:exodeoxyribonuclease-3
MPLKVATWNVNGARARQAEVQTLVEREQPDVLCLQEIKAAPDQLPVWLLDLEGYWCCWHGGKGYSGVALLVRRTSYPQQPAFIHPPFDFEHRAAYVELPGLTVASLYVPNGGKNFDAKIDFLEALVNHTAELRTSNRAVLLCGDFNVARAEMDVHAKDRKPSAIGQLPEERALFGRLLEQGLVDVNRAIDPDNDELFTWWAPWRQRRQRNIGWRIDYLLASEALAEHAISCRAEREIGTSDHGPVIAEFEI